MFKLVDSVRLKCVNDFLPKNIQFNKIIKVVDCIIGRAISLLCVKETSTEMKK